ncbi:MAG: 4-phosphopantetheinyl transferase [Gammaproteobacteria bacterium]|nr:4-phosphopantetheinyl transferase [Gammaproteobacteria bacterium]
MSLRWKIEPAGDNPSDFGQLQDQAHVWLANPHVLSAAAQQQRYEQWLSDTELTRYQRFRFDRDRHLYLVAHALNRVVLSRYTPGVDPAMWRFVTNEYGRPELEPSMPFANRLRFNISHTHGLVACIVTDGIDCGVDVEQARPLDELWAIAHSVFAERELADLRSLEVLDQHPRFYDYWTLKESYIKARGMGLSLPLQGFSFRFANGELQGVEFDPSLNDDATQWQFHVAQVASKDHKLAVGLKIGYTTPRQIVCRWLEP